ncbi:MAG: glycosyltransferase [Bacteroidota bacterium]|nr:glycosyltransferase [Bacteroidota bacterium]
MKTGLRIVQLIDSLEAGGAERMAVNYANALSKKIELSALVTTRKEGNLKNEIDSSVSYLFLNKTKTIDFKALFRFRTFIKEHRITHIHAHSSSFFLAVLLKLTLPSIKVIWHDHYGNSQFLEKRKSKTLSLLSTFFYGVISVNEDLKKWGQKNLKTAKISYLPNFVSLNVNSVNKTKLNGSDGKRIICLANLREQKNHSFLIDIATKIENLFGEWTFHLVGKDFKDTYSNTIRDLIKKYNLEEKIFIYGSRDDIFNILQQSDIAILTSKSEGLPVALLEYGFCSKPVVVTDVGEIATIVKDGVNGYLVTSEDQASFVEKLSHLIENENLRSQFGQELNKTIEAEYSENAVMYKYLDWINEE